MTAGQAGSRAARVRRRLGWFVRALVLLSVAALLQRHRMPLPAAVVATLGLASIAGALPTRIDVGWGWNDGPWLVGERQPLSLRLHNPTRRASAPSALRVSGPCFEPVLVPIPGLAPGERAVVVVDLALVARRERCVLTVACHVQNRLLGAPRDFPAEGSVLPVVRPRPDLPSPQLLRQVTAASDEGVSTGRRGSTDPMLVRAFVAGDPISSVHWRSTARAGSPVVVEREQLGTGRVVLLVAATPGPAEGAPTGAHEAFERMVSRAAGLVRAASSAGVPVSVVAAAGAAPLPGTANHDATQDWLAGLGRSGEAEPALLESAVRQADGGVVAVLTAQPWLAAEVRRLAPATTVLDLADPW